MIQPAAILAEKKKNQWNATCVNVWATCQICTAIEDIKYCVIRLSSSFTVWHKYAAKLFLLFLREIIPPMLDHAPASINKTGQADHFHLILTFIMCPFSKELLTLIYPRVSVCCLKGRVYPEHSRMFCVVWLQSAFLLAFGAFGSYFRMLAVKNKQLQGIFPDTQNILYRGEKLLKI